MNAIRTVRHTLKATLIRLRTTQRLAAVGLTLCCLLLPSQSAQAYPQRSDLDAFIGEMVTEHRFVKQDLQALFAQAKRKQSIVDAMNRPAEKTLTWGEYRNIFLTQKRIDKGIVFGAKHQQALIKAEQKYGVPAEVILAIIGVETFYGTNTGSYRVIDALSTLAFDYPKRAKFFRKQLKEFLLLAREQKQDPMALKGSYAGAMGYGQFIPSSYRAYAVDFSGDGIVDIWHNPTDAIGSVANYFSVHGWKANAPVTARATANDGFDRELLNQSLKPKHSLQQLAQAGFVAQPAWAQQLDPQQKATIMKMTAKSGVQHWLGLHNFYVITRYNHSRLYAMAVHDLSQAIKAKLP